MNRKVKQFLFGGPGSSSHIGDAGLLMLRVGTGFLMAFGHGLSKLWRDGSIGPPQQLIDGIVALNFPLPTLFAWMVAFTEFCAALLVAIGLLTRPMATLLVINMFVAAFLVHGNDPWFITSAAEGQGSKELALLFVIPYLTLVLTGPGRYSVDRVIMKRK